MTTQMDRDPEPPTEHVAPDATTTAATTAPDRARGNGETSADEVRADGVVGVTTVGAIDGAEPAGEESATAPAPITTVWNLSPVPVIVRGDGGELELQPLADARLDAIGIAFDEDALRRSPYVEVDTDEETDAFAVTASTTFWAAVIGSFVTAGVTDAGWVAAAVWTGLCIVVGLVTYLVVQGNRSRVRVLSRVATIALVLLIGFGIPIVVVAVGSGLYDIARSDPARLLEPGFNRVVIYRIGQVLFLGIAATFPVLLCFVFDRQSRDTLRSQFLRALFRLDGTIDSAAAWKARYLSQVEGTFGSIGSHSPRHGLLKKRSTPVVVTTLVLAIGWSMTFLNPQDLGLGAQPLVVGSPLRLFEPEATAVAFAFLGAYVFAVLAVLRSYMRADLRPKAYSQITARVLVVVVLTAPLSLLFSEVPTLVKALAFLAGLVPDTVLQLIFEAVRKISAGLLSSKGEFADPQPLTDLIGIDLYDRARLAEEGVTNVESLAHGDLVDLLLQTRIPAGRLVDWVDQAALRIQVDDPAYLASLRRNGIRTATDLLTLPEDHRDELLIAIHHDASTLPHGTGGQPNASPDGDGSGTGGAAGAARLTVLLDALSDSEWIVQLLHWRRDEARPMQRVDARTVREPAIVL